MFRMAIVLSFFYKGFAFGFPDTTTNQHLALSIPLIDVFSFSLLIPPSLSPYEKRAFQTFAKFTRSISCVSFRFFEEFAPLFRAKNFAHSFFSFSFIRADFVKETAPKGIGCSCSPLVLAQVA